MNPSRRRTLAISCSVAIAALGVLGAAPAGAESGSGVEQRRDQTGDARAGAERRGPDRAVEGATARHRNTDCPHHWPRWDYWPVRGPLVGGDGFGAFGLAALVASGRPPSAAKPSASGSSGRALAGVPAAPQPAAAPPSAPLGGPMPPGPPPPPPPPPTPAVKPAVKPVAAQPDPPRIGYPDYIRDATVAQIAALALAGAAGLGALTGAGGVVGYRQAKAGFALRAAGTARFLS